MSEISFFISGLPRPGGSKTATLIRRKGGEIVMKNGRALITTRESGKYTHEWRASCAFFARQTYTAEPLRGPVCVDFQFTMPRPKGHFGSGRNAGRLKATAPLYHTGKPDVLKLVRSTEDALTGILWADDCQTCEMTASKHYGGQPGCLVTVRELVAELAPTGVGRRAERMQ